MPKDTSSLPGLSELAVRTGDLELHACTDRLSREGEASTADISCWKESPDLGAYRFVICFWKRKSEGYDLHFVGRRPLEHATPEELWPLIRLGQDVLDEHYRSTPDESC